MDFISIAGGDRSVGFAIESNAAVPEPSTLTLLGTLLLGGAVWRFRRQGSRTGLIR
jgi:hypothetical protein